MREGDGVSGLGHAQREKSSLLLLLLRLEWQEVKRKEGSGGSSKIGREGMMGSSQKKTLGKASQCRMLS